MPEPLSGIDELRAAVRLFDRNSETFNDQFAPAELLTIARHYRQSAWDYRPDQWEERQVRECLEQDKTPDWQEVGGRVVAKYTDPEPCPCGEDKCQGF